MPRYEKHYLRDHIHKLNPDEREDLMLLYAKEVMKKKEFDVSAEKSFFYNMRNRNIKLALLVWFCNKMNLTLEQMFTMPERKGLIPADHEVHQSHEAA